MTLFLGIDGGATSTRCVLAREDRVIAKSNGRGTNLNRCSPEDVRDTLQTIIGEACVKAGTTPAEIGFGCFGAAGAAHPEIRDTLRHLLAQIVAGQIEVVTDVEIALDAAFPGPPSTTGATQPQGGTGVIVLAGTGSIAYGRNPLGETARAGGWGRAVSDEGSGYWIGRMAVSAALRALDAGQNTMLAAYVLEAVQATTREALARLCNADPPPDFSALFPAVLRAANEDDPAADELLAAAGIQLAELGRVVIRRLWPADEKVDLAVDGGVFRNSRRVLQVFEHFVLMERPEATVRLSPAEPVMGALARARHLAASGK